MDDFAWITKHTYETRETNIKKIMQKVIEQINSSANDTVLAGKNMCIIFNNEKTNQPDIHLKFRADYTLQEKDYQLFEDLALPISPKQLNKLTIAKSIFADIDSLSNNPYFSGILFEEYVLKKSKDSFKRVHYTYSPTKTANRETLDNLINLTLGKEFVIIPRDIFKSYDYFSYQLLGHSNKNVVENNVDPPHIKKGVLTTLAKINSTEDGEKINNSSIIIESEKAKISIKTGFMNPEIFDNSNFCLIKGNTLTLNDYNKKLELLNTYLNNHEPKLTHFDLVPRNIKTDSGNAMLLEQIDKLIKNYNDTNISPHEYQRDLKNLMDLINQNTPLINNKEHNIVSPIIKLSDQMTLKDIIEDTINQIPFLDNKISVIYGGFFKIDIILSGDKYDLLITKTPSKKEYIFYQKPYAFGSQVIKKMKADKVLGKYIFGNSTIDSSLEVRRYMPGTKKIKKQLLDAFSLKIVDGKKILYTYNGISKNKQFQMEKRFYYLDITNLQTVNNDTCIEWKNQLRKEGFDPNLQRKFGYFEVTSNILNLHQFFLDSISFNMGKNYCSMVNECTMKTRYSEFKYNIFYSDIDENVEGRLTLYTSKMNERTKISCLNKLGKILDISEVRL